MLFTALLFDWPRSYPQGRHFGCRTLDVAATAWTIYSQYCKAVSTARGILGSVITVPHILTSLSTRDSS